MKNLYILLFWVLVSACYDDLGNYDYNENINLVNIEVKEVYGVKKMDTTFVIRPVIHQTSAAGKGDLRFCWRMSTAGDQDLSNSLKGDTLSLADTVAIQIDTKSKDFKYTYWLRLYVEDLTTGSRVMYPVILSVVKPYEGAWAVLHRQEGVTKLGTVEYMGEEMLVTNDAYFQERGEHLQGEPVKLGKITYINPPLWQYDVATALYCFTDVPEESGILRQDDHFSLYGNVIQCVYPDHYEKYFNPSKVTMMESSGNGGLMVSGGRVFQGSSKGPRMYSMAPRLQEDYNVTHGACAGPIFLLYDAVSRRFFSCYLSFNELYFLWNWDAAQAEMYNQAKMELLPTSSANAPGINLSDIGSDKEMVYMGTGFYYGASMMANWQRISIYALAKSKETNQSWVYEFHAYPILHGSGSEEDPAPVSGVYPITTPTGMTTETPCATSVDYNRVMFYAVDNKVYRLDFGQLNGKSQLIWQHPDASARATVMRMAREDLPNPNDPEGGKFTAYGHSLNRSLGIAFELPGGTGEMVVLNLNNSGKVDSQSKYPVVQRHAGFGKIKDIVFI